ncbi:hypothetical protein PISMIDRAFT_23531 [Pisolithus microcarpus 441]|uniref:Uncharacterized protein n=1 Tax=Pisolithus microcarpus 441 TaxID=765257 RepID=A0A0C9ZTY5_9AGAM|nr:hypothetical protein PISMIDRAFT_23531 [Pisolithus microcarpus 441]
MAKKQQKLQAAHAQANHWQSRAQDADPPFANTPSADSVSSNLESGLEIDATGYEGGGSVQAGEWDTESEILEPSEVDGDSLYCQIGHSSIVVLMWNIFMQKDPLPAEEVIHMDGHGEAATDSESMHSLSNADIRLTVGIGYLSDLSADDSSESKSETGPNTTVATTSCQPPEHQPLNKQKLDAPSCIQQEWRKAEQAKSWMDGLLTIEKLLKLKMTHFVGGPSGLQAKWTCAITSYLALVVHKNHCWTVASQLAAESHGPYFKSMGR